MIIRQKYLNDLLQIRSYNYLYFMMHYFEATKASKTNYKEEPEVTHPYQ